MKMMFCMLIKKVFYKLIVLFWAGSNTTYTVCYISDVLPAWTLLGELYISHTKSFLHLSSCLCSISTFLFQVIVGSCKFAFLVNFADNFFAEMDCWRSRNKGDYNVWQKESNLGRRKLLQTMLST